MKSSQHGRITIGILAIQGAFIEHENVLKSLSNESVTIECVRVRSIKDLVLKNAPIETVEEKNSQLDSSTSQISYRWLDALILPGGESTTMALLLEKERYLLGENEPSSVSFLDVLRFLISVHHIPVWGTCAGAILLADNVMHAKQGGQALLGGLNVTMERNAYGSQVDSFETMVNIRGIPNSEQMFPAVFIRAPAIRNILTEDVEILAEWQDTKTVDCQSSIVAVKEGMILVTTFHPELTKDTRMHEYFLCMISHRAEQSKQENEDKRASSYLEKIIKVVT
jgi:pyridoxal 5'-phosphate synthase pdxT subunit